MEDQRRPDRITHVYDVRLDGISNPISVYLVCVDPMQN
jgi:hypothetical protein